MMITCYMYITNKKLFIEKWSVNVRADGRE